MLVGFRALKQPGQWRWWLALGGLAGLALTAKYSAVLLPLEIIFISWLAWRTTRPGPVGFQQELKRLIGAGAALVVGCSWWFGFMVWHFNTVAAKGWVVGILEPLIVRGAADSTAVSIAAFLFGEKDLSAEAPLAPLQRNYAELTEALLDSFWAGPVNGHYFGSSWLAPLFTLAAVGLGLTGLYFVWRRAEATAKTWLALLLFHVLLITPLLAVRLFLSFDPREVAQGRHLLMPGASALAILLVCGWDYWPQNKSVFYRRAAAVERDRSACLGGCGLPPTDSGLGWTG
ncbi:MAG: hypothetical protein HC875_33275 [Anaerolineales bacterium]|nr:hypothetical protein [Anaerolineales bacterium]